MYYDLRNPCLFLLYEKLFSAGQTGHEWVLLKTEKDFCHRKEISGNEKDLDMACYAIKTYVK